MDRMVFGMHHLNITQIGTKYDGKSHLSHVSYELDLAGEDAGIDYWKNMMPNTLWYCAGVFGNSSTGNTRFFWSYGKDKKKTKVMCADGQSRYLTLALTHSNKNYQVGKYYGYEEVMYQEGTSGKATGNHIHLETCEGFVKTKVKNSAGYYSLQNMLDARNVFFILDGFTTVVSTDDLEFKHCNSVECDESEDTGMELDYGYTSPTINNLQFHIYRGKKESGYGLHILTAEQCTTKNIADFDNDKISKLAVVNASYFQMSSSQSDPYGTIYGVVKDKSFNQYAQYLTQDNLYVLFETSTGEIKVKPCKEFEYAEYADCAWCITPYAVRIQNGEEQISWSKALGDKDDTKNTQTFMLHFTNGDYAIGIMASKACPRDVVSAMKQYDGLDWLALFDSGGSTQMRAWTGGAMKTILGTGRKIPDVLCIGKIVTETANTGDSDSGSTDDTPSKETSDNDELRKEITELTNDVTALEAEVSDYKDKLKAMTTERDSYQKLYTELDTAFEQYKNQVKAKAQEIIDMA